MLVEGLIIAGGYLAYNYIMNYDIYKLKYDWNAIMKENNVFNSKNQTFQLVKIRPADYGYFCIVNIPIGYSFEEFERLTHIIESNLKCMVELEHDKFNGWINMRLIKTKLKDLKFSPIPTKPHQLYLGYTFYDNVIVDMYIAPNVLIGGLTGAGKTFGLYSTITNLIHNHDEKEIEIYITQPGKTEMMIFEDCVQVKGFAKRINESLDMLEHIYNEFKRRESLIEKLTKTKGIVDIKTYNKKMTDKLTHIYLISEELSLYMPDSVDSKEEKKIKSKCLDYLKLLIKLGRAYGIYIIMCLQKTTADQMPTLLKSEVYTKISYRQSDENTSRNIIGTDEAWGLPNREAIVISDNKYHIKTPEINTDIIRQYISHRIKPKERKEVKKTTTKPIQPLPDGFIKRGGNYANRA